MCSATWTNSLSVPNQLHGPLTDKYVLHYYVVGINEFCFSVIKWADVIMYLNLM